jgi:hypothetical protein
VSDRLEREQVFDRREVSIARLNGRPRSGDGRHRRLVGYVAADVTVPELVRLLRECADQLARSLPRLEP